MSRAEGREIERRATTLDTVDAWAIDAGGRLLVQARGESFFLVDLTAGASIGAPVQVGAEISSLAISQDLATLAVGVRGGAIWLYRLAGLEGIRWSAAAAAGGAERGGDAAGEAAAAPPESASTPEAADDDSDAQQSDGGSTNSETAEGARPMSALLEGPGQQTELPRLGSVLTVRARPEPEFAGDPRSPASVTRAVLQNGDMRLRRCFQRSLIRHEDPSGQLLYSLDVNVGGAGQRPIEPIVDTFGSEELLRCMEELLLGALFGSGTGHMHLDVEFEVQVAL